MYRTAIQSDPPETFDQDGDTTLAIALEALKNRHELFYYHPASLSNDRTHIKAFVHRLMSTDGKNLEKSTGEWRHLTNFDVILIRQDPPFDISYITATYFLEQIADRVKIVNHPKALRNFPEKILPPSLQHFLPPTLISADLDLIKNFAEEHNHDIIIKPLYGNGGRGIFRVKPGDNNLAVILESLTAIENVPVITQAFVPAISKGDKRIILIGGKVGGAINRIASAGENRSNLHVGGHAHLATLTTKEKKICETLTPFLKENGIVLAGIDVIGDYLTEINITSPTGFREYQQFTGTNLATSFWDEVSKI